MKERESPVVHQQVRGPDQFRVDSDAFHASILAYIPVQLVVEPVLGNIFFEKCSWDKILCSPSSTTSRLSKAGSSRPVESYLNLTDICDLYFNQQYPICLFVTDGCVIENVSSGNKLTRECV